MHFRDKIIKFQSSYYAIYRSKPKKKVLGKCLKEQKEYNLRHKTFANLWVKQNGF